MPWKETLYERPLRRPFDETVRRAIEDEYLKRRNELPVPTELHWHKTQPQFTLKSQWLSFVGRFQGLKLVVEAELSLAAKMMVTDQHRRDAVRVIDEIVAGLEL